MAGSTDLGNVDKLHLSSPKQPRRRCQATNTIKCGSPEEREERNRNDYEEYLFLPVKLITSICA